jgi:glyoxylase-like metal-dependent hydrolase (beta-lactamase superfamily II)
MIVRQRLVSSMQNFGYLVVDEQTLLAAVIDPSFDARPLQEEARLSGARISLILNTHGHGDHCRDNERLKKETGARVAAHVSARHEKDVALRDGDTIELGQLVFRVLHTPGHCPDACCFVVEQALFTGDTLFVGDCGRVDLPESDVDAMYDSLLTKLCALPDDLVVYPGHDYGPRPTSTLGAEKAGNRTLARRSLEQFRQFMLS